MSKFFLTTPIYYVNDVPHIGHAYTTIASDVLARWYRAMTRKSFFSPGPTSMAPKSPRPPPLTIRIPDVLRRSVRQVSRGVERAENNQRRLYPNDVSGTCAPVQAFLKALWDKGVIFQARYQGKYCVQCERFYAEDELIGGLCPDHRIPPETQSEDNYFFRLSQFKDELLAAITDENHPIISRSSRGSAATK